jgi:hypothetical protein
MHTFEYKPIKHPSTTRDRDQLILVLDGEPLLESWVHEPLLVPGQETPIVGRTMGAGSIDASRLLAKIPIAELLAEFETVHVSIEPEIGEFIDNVVAITRRKVDGIRNPRIRFEISLDMDNWKRPWSPAELIEMLSRVASNRVEEGLTFHERYDTLSGDCLSAPLDDMSCTISDLVVKWRSSVESIFDQTLSSLAVAIRRESLVTFFEFPPSVKVACQQYLIYFVQFLADLGIEADAELKEESQRVLFCVTPRSGTEALWRIREALEAFLHLPQAPNMGSEVARYPDIAVLQLQANVDHLKSQLTLASAILQAKNATIEALELSNFQYRQLVQAGESFARGPDQLPVPAREPSPEKESLFGGVLSIKKIQRQGL